MALKIPSVILLLSLFLLMIYAVYVTMSLRSGAIETNDPNQTTSHIYFNWSMLTGCLFFACVPFIFKNIKLGMSWELTPAAILSFSFCIGVFAIANLIILNDKSWTDNVIKTEQRRELSTSEWANVIGGVFIGTIIITLIGHKLLFDDS